jgi:hypothetical protein
MMKSTLTLLSRLLAVVSDHQVRRDRRNIAGLRDHQDVCWIVQGSEFEDSRSGTPTIGGRPGLNGPLGGLFAAPQEKRNGYKK